MSAVLGSRGRAYTRVRATAGANAALVAITAVDAFTTRSFEELRFEDAFQTFHLRRAPRHETLLEGDVLGAISELVLDQPRWWEAFEADEAPMLEAVAARATRVVCGDAAYHVLQWMTPTARRARLDGVELSLSRLMDYLPAEVAASTTFQDSVERAQSHSKRLCRATGVAPWLGAEACSCSSLQPLADAIATQMMALLDAFRPLQTETTTTVPAARILEVLLRGDAPSLAFLISVLVAHVPTVLNDMKNIVEFSRHYLQSVVKTHSPATTNISPAPLRGSYLRDSVAVSVPSNFSVSSRDARFEYSVSESGHVSDTSFHSEPMWGSKLDLQGLVCYLVPKYEKVLGEAAQFYSSQLVQSPPAPDPSSWISMPDRAVLIRAPSCVAPSTSLSLRMKRLRLVASIVSAPRDSVLKEEWIAVKSQDRSAAAFAVVLLHSGDHDAPTMHVRFPPDVGVDRGFPVDENSSSFDHLPRKSLSISLSSSSGSTTTIEPRRCIVLPAYAEFRLASANPSKPSSWIAAVVTLCNPRQNVPPTARVVKATQLLILDLQWDRRVSIVVQPPTRRVRELTQMQPSAQFQLKFLALVLWQRQYLRPERI